MCRAIVRGTFGYTCKTRIEIRTASHDARVMILWRKNVAGGTSVRFHRDCFSFRENDKGTLKSRVICIFKEYVPHLSHVTCRKVLDGRKLQFSSNFLFLHIIFIS